MTVKANRVTSWPAAYTEIERSRASSGSSPTIRNSVDTMTKAAAARMLIASVPERIGAQAEGKEDSVMKCVEGWRALYDIGDRISYLRYFFLILRNWIH